MAAIRASIISHMQPGMLSTNHPSQPNECPCAGRNPISRCIGGFRFALFLAGSLLTSVWSPTLAAAEAPEISYPTLEQRKPSPGHVTYHIDPSAGDDSNTGTSRGKAWKTFHPINQLRLAPGDKVEIDAPGKFSHTLSLAGTGSAEQPVEVRFAPGRFDFHPDDMFREAYQISNTNDVPDGPKAVAILLAGVKHLRLSGPGASIVCRGKMIETCIDGCEDVTIAGLSFDYQRPTVSEFSVAAVGDGHVDLSIHRDSSYAVENGTIVWKGEGWSHTTGLAQELDPATGILRRRKDPLAGLVCKEIKPFLVRATGKCDMKPGRIYQIRETLRDCAGFFTRNSRDVTWRNINIRFMHGMGMVSQFSENLTFDSVVIAPDKAGGRTTAAWADCIHVSGCKGAVVLRNCVFSGAHDDALNIHGTYLRVVERLPGDKIKVRFMQPQTFGFMAFHKGDGIEFVHSASMEDFGTNRILEARMLNPKELLLTLEKPLPEDFEENDVIENVTWTPEVEIRGCKVSHIPTRGFLLSTRRKVLVEDNEFHATHMSAILVAGDARSWFESGGVRDMTVRNNRFINCGEPVVSINPDNSDSNDSIHRNIRIENNRFDLAGRVSVKASGTTGLRVTGNRISSVASLDDARSIRTEDCDDVVVENNIYQRTAK